jgi:hypothetical protein
MYFVTEVTGLLVGLGVGEVVGFPVVGDIVG